MEIKDQSGKDVPEITLSLSEEEITELLVAASEIDDGTADHALMRDRSGRTLAVYLDKPPEMQPLQRGIDWWVGPLILTALLLMVIGAFTLAKAAVEMLF